MQQDVQADRIVYVVKCESGTYSLTATGFIVTEDRVLNVYDSGDAVAVFAPGYWKSIRKNLAITG